MNWFRHCGIIVGLSMALTALSWAGPVVDRVVTSVNGHVVLPSDWEQEIAFEALMNGRSPDSFTTAERKAALDRLIDQELLREQVRPGETNPSPDVMAKVAEIRKLQPDSATEEGWQATLRRCGLTQKALEKQLTDEIQLMKLVEERLRPSIQIDQEAVERYYHDELLPEIERTGGSAKPLTEVYSRIKNLLAEKKMNELITGWLASLRSGSRIQTPEYNAGETNR